MKVVLDFRIIPQTGIWNYSVQLAQALQKQDVEVGEIHLPATLLRGSSLTGWRGIQRLGWENSALPLQMRRQSADLFHCTNNFGIPYWMPCPSVLTIHDFVPLDFPDLYLPQWQKRQAYKLFLRHSVHKAAYIITISDYTQAELLRRFPEASQKSRRVYHGCGEEYRPLADQRQADATLHKLGLTSNFVLTVGGTEPRKNVGSLVEVFKARWANGEPTPQLVIVGEEWRGIKPNRWNATPNVVFAGQVGTTELIDLYNACLFLAFPSLLEGFGLPVLEAMGCGTPVLAMRASAIPEVAGEAAILVDPVEPGELAEACRRMIEDGDLRADLAAKGLRRAAGFSWERCARETLDVYREALKGGTG